MLGAEQLGDLAEDKIVRRFVAVRIMSRRVCMRIADGEVATGQLGEHQIESGPHEIGMLSFVSLVQGGRRRHGLERRVSQQRRPREYRGRDRSTTRIGDPQHVQGTALHAGHLGDIGKQPVDVVANADHSA